MYDDIIPFSAVVKCILVASPGFVKVRKEAQYFANS